MQRRVNSLLLTFGGKMAGVSLYVCMYVCVTVHLLMINETSYTLIVIEPLGC